MKTNSLFLSWLRYAALLLLAFTGGVSAVAQDIEGGEAFYIYQNDGHFDGFFYDQVKQISYSRFDTLGIEHDKYVSQEIVTEDSVYRIMLTAIDSVSFVQPEIKYAKAVRFMRDEGLMNYYLNAVKNGEDEIVVTFRSTMPASLRPKVGDVLQCPNLEGWEEGTLVAKVQKVSESGSVLTCTCGYVEDLKDVFEQFITVEQVRNVETPQGSRTYRRIAGIDAPRRVEDHISDFTLFSFSHTFEAKANITQKLKLQFMLNVGFGMTLSAAYKITLTEFYIKTSAKYQTAVGGSFGLDGELYDNPELSSLPGIGDFVKSFTRIPFPANFPILLLHGMPEPFARAEAHLNIGVAWAAQAQASSFMLEIKDTKPYLDIKMSKVAPFLPFNSETESGFSINVQLNGSVQSGLKFPLKVSTQDWLKKIAYSETGLDIYAGPKLSGVLNFDAIKAGQGKGMYESLKDSKIDLSLMSIDAEAAGKIRFLGVDWETKHTKSWVYGNTSYLLLPQFGDVNFNIIGDNLDHITCNCDLEGLTCLPETVGIGIYCKENENDKDFSKLYDSFFMPDVIWYKDNINKVEGGFTKVEPGEYRLRPIISVPGLGGFEKLLIPVYDKEVAVTIEQKGLTLDPEEAFFDEEGGQQTVKIGTKQSKPVTVTPSEKWITVQVTQPSEGRGGSMIVKVDPNEEDRLRQGYVTVVQGSGDDDQKTFTVKQFGGLQLSVSKLDFESDGGTGLVEILTSRKPININTQGADWIKYNLDDRNLTITASENKGAQRTAVVIVSAWSEKYQGISTIKLTVTQKGEVDAVVEPKELSFEATGGTKRVNIGLGKNTTFNDVIVAKKDQQWILVEKAANYFNVTALPNTETKQRQSIIDVSVTTTGEDGKDRTVLLPVTITQQFGSASVTPSELHFTAEGGSQSVKVDVSTYPYCGAMIGDDGNGWVDVSISNGGVVTITTKANAGTTQRECTVQCYVSGVKNPGDDQMIKLPVRVVQAGRSLAPVTPDGDKSPFKYINFVSSRWVEYISASEGKADTLSQVAPAFSFTPNNAHFSVKYDKNYNHYECVGYQEWSANDTKTRATLSFDIEKKTKKVKNLRFTMDSEFLMSMHWPGATINMTNNIAMVVLPDDIPLESSSSTYKYGKLSAAEGLTFSSFSAVLDTRATYTLNELGKELYGDGIDPQSEHVTYEPYGDPRDYVEITISYKDGQGEPIDLEWPSDAVMNSLKAGGMPVYDGENPPSIEGTYELSDLTLVADKLGAVEELESIDNIVLRFSGQKGGEVKFDAYFVVNGMATEANGEQPALISGSGNQFSICIPEGDGSAIIISGTVSNGGISDLYYSTTSMTETDQYIILKDGTGSSSKTTWAPGS